MATIGTTYKTFSENYVTLLNSLSEHNCHIKVSGLLPRKSANLKSYNDILKEMCTKDKIEFIDSYDCFLLASGEMPSSLFHHDKVHLNVHGTRRLSQALTK